MSIDENGTDPTKLKNGGQQSRRWRSIWTRSGYFAPSRIESLLILLIAIVVGLWIYRHFVRGTYVELYEEYRIVSVTRDILAQDPAFPPAPGDTVTAQEDARRLFRALQLLKLLTEEDTLEGVTKQDSAVPAKIVFDALALDGTSNEERGPNKADRAKSTVAFTSTPTVEVVVRLVFNMGAASGYSQDPNEIRALADLVAAVLANQPGAAQSLRTELEKQRLGQPTRPPSEITKDLGTDLGTLSGFVFSAENPEPMSDLELIASLYQLAGVDRAYDPQKVEKDGKERPEGQARLRAMTKFLESLIERLRGDHKVKKIAKEIPLWKGYEQSIMWVLFWWTLLLLLYRGGRLIWIKRKYTRHFIKWLEETVVESMRDKIRNDKSLDDIRKEEAAFIRETYGDIEPTDPHRLFRLRDMAGRIALVAANCVSTHLRSQGVETFHAYCNETRKRENSNRWFIRYLTFALPAIGFIGTKRGIAGALSQADLIVRAQDPGAQAAAIGTVTSILGIAFTTTLIALMMGLLINLVNSAQSYAEAAVIDQIEESLAPLVNPARTIIASQLASAALSSEEKSPGNRKTL
jgi:hypothetical protein